MITNISVDTLLIEEVIALNGTQNKNHQLNHRLVDAIVERVLREYVQRNKEPDVQSTHVDHLNDLLAASASSLGFWDNEIDDAEWNNA
ncbi:MAG: type II toxin-antitoxin system VapB family antitoxin [Alkalinema sp. CAN_BIN05]|nr:type II toxin-antitoxin system VapB family antitoxin [Alkalinema sp. CAN_BIN05]